MNVDNLVVDINGRRNVAGSGISQAQRIMDKADANQILIGQTVFDRLSPREKYMSKFRGYVAQGKHGTTFHVYQYVDKTVTALNTDTPATFQAKKLLKPRFTKFAAYYVAHAIKNREFLLSCSEVAREEVGTVLLFYLAMDSVSESERPIHKEARPKTWGSQKASFTEQFKHYDDIDFPVIMELSQLIVNVHLDQYVEYFEASYFGPIFVTSAGCRKLTFEWPSIAKEIGVADETPAQAPPA